MAIKNVFQQIITYIENICFRSDLMNINLEDKKKEAIKRMKLFGIFPDVIEQFENKGLVSESEPPFGTCFWINNDQSKRIKNFEKKYNALVYFVIHSYTSMGEFENYLYISDYKDDWNLDIEDIKDNRQLVYVFNSNEPELSEFGSIGIELTPTRGLNRIW